MLTVTHYEPNEFLMVVSAKQLNIFCKVYVLDCGIAGFVFMCKDQDNLYYLDRFYPSLLKKEEFNKKDTYEIHQELYVKINLDKQLRTKY